MQILGRYQGGDPAGGIHLSPRWQLYHSDCMTHTEIHNGCSFYAFGELTNGGGTIPTFVDAFYKALLT